MKVNPPATEMTMTRVSDGAAARHRERVEHASRPSPEATQQGQISRDDLEKIVETMNTAAQVFSRALQFKVVEGQRLIVKVVDTTTDEVVSEFPPERLVEALRSIEVSLGLLVDKKV